MAAGITYVPIQSVTLTTITATVTLGSGGTIPQTYTDLRLVISGAGNGGSGGNVYIQLNGDTSATYSYTRAVGDGSAASSARAVNSGAMIVGDAASSDKIMLTIDLFNYTNSSTKKTVLSRSSSSSFVSGYVGLWSATPQAITSILFTLNSQSMSIGTTLTLYGIAAA